MQLYLSSFFSRGSSSIFFFFFSFFFPPPPLNYFQTVFQVILIYRKHLYHQLFITISTYIKSIDLNQCIPKLSVSTTSCHPLFYLVLSWITNFGVTFFSHHIPISFFCMYDKLWNNFTKRVNEKKEKSLTLHFIQPQACLPGSYGRNCSQECGPNCKPSCDRFNGVCKLGCNPGWQGSYCNTSNDFYICTY